MTVEVVSLALVMAVIGLISGSTLATGASPMPSSRACRRVMLEALPDVIDGPIYELGSGWGGLAVALARRYPACRVRGIEVSLLPWAVSRLRVAILGPANLTVTLGNFLNADLTDAAVVACYLTTGPMKALKPKLEKDLRPGTLVLSNTFAVRGWEPVAVETAPDAHRSKIYLYRIGG